MSTQMTLWDTPSAISSRALVDGPTHLPLPACLLPSNCGLDHARANLSARQAREKGFLTSATYGPLLNGLSHNVGLLCCLVNRLQRRLDTLGGPEYVTIWKALDMKQGPPICALLASARRTSGKGCTGWPTVIATDGKQSDYQYSRNGKKILKLNGVVKLAGWASPSARDWKDSSNMEVVALNPDGSLRMRRDQLPRQAVLAHQHTPTHGENTNGCSATTEKRGALNPAFCCWLMGFPAEFHLSGVTAMQLFRR